MTAAAFQSLGISDDTKERLNRLVIGVATISADNFRKRGSRLSGRGRGSQVESMASRRKMLIEILNYSGLIGGDRVSYPQCSGQLGGGVLILHGLYSVSKLFGISATGCKFLFEKASLSFPN